MRIVMEPIERLPDAELHRDRPVSRAFLQRGAATFLDACRLVQRLPYGPNAHGQGTMALFDDGQGTCTTKHGIIVQLAGECDLGVGKTLGFYRLNEEIVTGIADILRPAGVAFVPSAHCFLEMPRNLRRPHRGQPERQRTGRSISSTSSLRVPADESAHCSHERYREYLDRYAAIEPRLAALGPDRVLDLVKACHAQMERRRTETVAVQADINAGWSAASPVRIAR